jgi:hypothetical protein
MILHRRDLPRGVFVAALVFLAVAREGEVLAGAHNRPDVIQVAQAPDTPPRELEPRYEPVPPPPKSWYNDSYLFGMTRGVANSTLVPAAKAPLFLLTVPLDLVLLPFAAIGGLFG